MLFLFERSSGHELTNTLPRVLLIQPSISNSPTAEPAPARQTAHRDAPTGSPAAAPARPRTTVVHCRNAPPDPDTYDVYIGRGFGATDERWGRPCPWGNRFKIRGENTPTARQTAANRHREWLHRPERPTSAREA